ncbi:MAG: hypothetical protein V1703_03805 [Candidatus Altiarchaeota archaeon]
MASDRILQWIGNEKRRGWTDKDEGLVRKRRYDNALKDVIEAFAEEVRRERIVKPDQEIKFLELLEKGFRIMTGKPADLGEPPITEEVLGKAALDAFGDKEETMQVLKKLRIVAIGMHENVATHQGEYSFRTDTYPTETRHLCYIINLALLGLSGEATTSERIIVEAGKYTKIVPKKLR